MALLPEREDNQDPEHEAAGAIWTSHRWVLLSHRQNCTLCVGYQTKRDQPRGIFSAQSHCCVLEGLLELW